MIHKIKGTIKQITPAEPVGDKFKCLLVLDNNDGQYTDTYAIEAYGTTIVEKVQQHRVGEEVEVAFTVRSREYQGKWYTNLSLYSFNEKNN